MKYTQLGKSPLLISEIGFGCMSLPAPEKTAIAILEAAFDLGINYFDTADIYAGGLNEKTVGRAFRNRRDKIVLATKVGNQPKSDGSGLDWNPRKDYILKQVENSLQRLDTDYIDLYQLHGGTINDPIDETIEAFELLVEQGKIRYYGISSIRPNVIREYVQRSSIVSVMMQYSLADRRPEETCFPLLLEKGISVLCRGALAQGLLAGKPARDYLGHTSGEISAIADEVNTLSDGRRSAAQTAIRFVLQQPAVTSAVTGIRTMEQLRDAVGAAGVPPLTEEELKSLKKVASAKVYTDHR